MFCISVRIQIGLLKAPGVRSSVVDVVQLMLHAVEACLNSLLACSGVLLSSFSSSLSLWHHCQSSEHWKDFKWLLLLVMIFAYKLVNSNVT